METIPKFHEETIQSSHLSLEKLLDTGSEYAFRKIIGFYQDPLRKYVVAQTGNIEEVNDIVHDSFLSLWTNYVLKGKAIFNVRALLFQIARHLSINHIRRERIARIFRRKGSDEEPVTTPCERLNEKEKNSLALQIFFRLPRKDREILTLYYIEQIPREEIASILSIHFEAVNSRLRRARSKLKTLFHQKWSNFDE